MDRLCPKRRKTDNVLSDQEVYQHYKKTFFENLEQLNDKRFVPKCVPAAEWPTAFIVNLHHDSFSICLDSIVTDLETDSIGYEESDLLWYIDNQTVPPEIVPLMEQLAKVSDNKLIAELRDFRGINKTLKCPLISRHVLNKPTESSVLELYDTLGDQMSLTNLQQLENYLIIMNEEPLCLDPSTDVFTLESLIDFNKRKKYATSLQRLVRQEKYSHHGNHDNSCTPSSTISLNNILGLASKKAAVPAKECDKPIAFKGHIAPDMSKRIAELATIRLQAGQEKPKVADDKGLANRVNRENSTDDHQLISPHHSITDNMSPGYMVTPTPPAPPQLKPAPFITSSLPPALHNKPGQPPTMHTKPDPSTPNRMAVIDPHNKPKIFNQNIAYVMQHPMNKMTPPNMITNIGPPGMMTLGPAGQKTNVPSPTVQNIRPNQPQMMPKQEQMAKPLANPGVMIGQQAAYPRQYQYQDMSHIPRGYQDQSPYLPQRGAQMMLSQPLTLPPNMNPHVMSPGPPHLAPVHPTQQQIPPHPGHPVQMSTPMVRPAMRQQQGIAPGNIPGNIPANLTPAQMNRANFGQQMQINQIQNPNLFNPNMPNQFG